MGRCFLFNGLKDRGNLHAISMLLENGARIFYDIKFYRVW